VIITGVWFTVNRHHISYGIKQLKGQLNIIQNSIPIETILNDSLISDSIKQKINFIQEVKSFAEENLGLKKTNNYSTFYDQQNNYPLWVLSACKALSFEEHEWKFPIFGRSTYKGFFNKGEGTIEQLELIRQGFDTDLSPASAWSTLGFFKDPILSSMFNKSEGKLAELIIHELTHSTIFIKNDIDFNENLATFIGEQGARLFLEYKFSKESSQYQFYSNELHDQQLYELHFLKAYQLLDSLYTRNHTPSIQRKYSIISQTFQTLDTLKVKNNTKYTYYRSHLPNNSFFVDFKRYRIKQTDFSKEMNDTFGNNLKAFIKHYSN